MKRLSAFLYCLGLSYDAVRQVLAELGCPLSATSIRRNVAEGYGGARSDFVPERLRVRPAGSGRALGPEGALAIRLAGPSTMERWVEVEVRAGPAADELRWRLAHCTGDELPPFADRTNSHR